VKYLNRLCLNTLWVYYDADARKSFVLPYGFGGCAVNAEYDEVVGVLMAHQQEIADKREITGRPAA
jgi:hypothetical protein